MIFKQFFIGFILRHFTTYKNVVLLCDDNNNNNPPPSHDRFNLDTNSLHNTLPISSDVFQTIIAINKQNAIHSNSGLDNRPMITSTVTKNETTVEMLYEYYIKLALIQILEKDTISQAEKLRLIREYEKNINKSKLTNNLWKGLYENDF